MLLLELRETRAVQPLDETQFFACVRAGFGQRRKTLSNALCGAGKIPKETVREALSAAGIRMHLGKGALKSGTVRALKENQSVYAVIPPVTALLESKTISKKLVAFPELGMEALYELEVSDYPAVVAIANGESIYGNV